MLSMKDWDHNQQNYASVVFKSLIAKISVSWIWWPFLYRLLLFSTLQTHKTKEYFSFDNSISIILPNEIIQTQQKAKTIPWHLCSIFPLIFSRWMIKIGKVLRFLWNGWWYRQETPYIFARLFISSYITRLHV